MVSRVPAGSRAGGQYTTGTKGKKNVPTAKSVRLKAAKESETLKHDPNHPLKFTLVSEDRGCTPECSSYETQIHSEDISSYWPHDEVRTYLITGDLADRIRKRINDTSGEPVYYIDKRVDESYSDWTDEYHFEFTLKVGTFKKEFGSYGYQYQAQANGLVDLIKWLQEKELGKEANAVATSLGFYESFKERAIKYFDKDND